MKRLAIPFAIVVSLTSCASANLIQSNTVAAQASTFTISTAAAKTAHVEAQWHRLATVVKQLKLRVNRTPYVFSGDTPRGWDCSGLTAWAYRQIGVTLPHSANAQGYLGHVTRAPRAGDLVTFGFAGGYGFNHAGIYLGKGLVLNANSYYRTTVIEPLSNYKHGRIRFVAILPRTVLAIN